MAEKEKKMKIEAEKYIENLRQMEVLIIQCGSLGVEIALHLLQSGVKKIGFHDKSLVTKSDLGANFIVVESLNNTQTRSAAAIAWFTNKFKDTVLADESNATIEDAVSKYKLIICSEPIPGIVKLNQDCRKIKRPFVYGFALGLLGSVFVDFTTKNMLKEPTQLQDHKIVYITKEERPKVYTETQHNFENGMKISIKDVEGMAEINGKESEIRVLDPYTFELLEFNSTAFSNYTTKGIAHSESISADNTFCSLEDILKNPYQHCKELNISEYKDPKRVLQLHVITRAIIEFVNKNKRLPAIGNKEDNISVESLCNDFRINDPSSQSCISLMDKGIMSGVYLFASLQIPFTTMFVASIVAQEVLKYCSELKPIKQMMHYDFIDTIPESPKLFAFNNDAKNKEIVAIYDNTALQALQKDVLIVADSERVITGFPLLNSNSILECTIRCAILMGTPIDKIFVLGANRQTLDSMVTVNGKKINNIEFTKDTYKAELRKLENAFWDKLSLVFIAASNIEIINKISKQCAIHNINCIRMALTKYGYMVTPQIGGCTAAMVDYLEKKPINKKAIDFVPSKKSHFIMWAKILVKNEFKRVPYLIKLLHRNYQDFYSCLVDFTGYEAIKMLNYMGLVRKAINNGLIELIKLAYLRFNEVFNNNVQDVLKVIAAHDKENKFWKSKKSPIPIIFDVQKESHVGFIIEYIKLFATTYKVKIPGIEELKVIIHNTLSLHKLEPYVETQKTIEYVQNQIEKALQPNRIYVDSWPQEISDQVQALLIELKNTTYEISKNITILTFKVINKEKLDLLHATAILRAAVYSQDQWNILNTYYLSMDRGIPLAIACPAGIAMAEGMKAINGIKSNDNYKNITYCIPNGKLTCTMPEYPSSRENANHKIKYVDHIGYIPQGSTIYTTYNNVKLNNTDIKILKELLNTNKEIFNAEENKIPEYEICTIHVKREMIYNMYDYSEADRVKPKLNELYDEAFKYFPHEKAYIFIKVMIKMKESQAYLKLPRIKCNINK